MTAADKGKVQPVVLFDLDDTLIDGRAKEAIPLAGSAHLLSTIKHKFTLGVLSSSSGVRMRQAIERLQKSEDEDNGGILKRVGRAHYELVRIYPFQHASGKVARLFMNLLMIRAGLPPAIIHAAERQRYYDGLKSASAAQIVQMLENALDNSISSIDKLLDRHESRSARS